MVGAGGEAGPGLLFFLSVRTAWQRAPKMSRAARREGGGVLSPGLNCFWLDEAGSAADPCPVRIQDGRLAREH